MTDSKKVAQLHCPVTQPRNFNTKECNTQHNPDATIDLKVLADAFLERNKQRNFCATEKLHGDSNILKHGISMQELEKFLGEDWDDYKDNPKALEFWSDLLFTNALMDQGKAPDNFTAITYCNLCGYVYVPPELTNGGNVLGCPWCFNRVKGLIIPKPVGL